MLIALEDSQGLRIKQVDFAPATTKHDKTFGRSAIYLRSFSVPVELHGHAKGGTALLVRYQGVLRDDRRVLPADVEDVDHCALIARAMPSPTPCRPSAVELTVAACEEVAFHGLLGGRSEGPTGMHEEFDKMLDAVPPDAQPPAPDVLPNNSRREGEAG